MPSLDILGDDLKVELPSGEVVRFAHLDYAASAPCVRAAADAVQDAFLNVMRRLPKLEGRDLVFGSYLFTATRNASYDLMQKRKRAEPSDAMT